MSSTVDVTFPATDGRPMRAALALPNAKDRRPGVIVIHELLGLNDDIRKHTARVAGMGYVALAPDLFDKPGPRALCVARTMMATRSGDGEALEDLEAARQWLAARPEVDSKRIGVIGFCMGGGFALLFATKAPLKVSAPFYGEVPQTKEALAGICPVVASFGGRDMLFGRNAEKLDHLLTEMGVEHDVKLYPNAGHSFVSEHTGLMATLGAWGPLKVGFDPAAAEDAWERVRDFFSRYLG